jgi:hypothetical protein
MWLMDTYVRITQRYRFRRHLSDLGLGSVTDRDHGQDMISLRLAGPIEERTAGREC